MRYQPESRFVEAFFRRRKISIIPIPNEYKIVAAVSDIAALICSQSLIAKNQRIPSKLNIKNIPITIAFDNMDAGRISGAAYVIKSAKATNINLDIIAPSRRPRSDGGRLYVNS